MSTDQQHDAIFKALSDARRREILDLLSKKPRTTGELCKRFKELNRCTVMQHLGVLENAHLINVKRTGRYRWNYFNPLPLKQVYERWIHPYANNAIELLAKMKYEIEK